MIGLLRRYRRTRTVPAVPLRASDIPAAVRARVDAERREVEEERRSGLDRRQLLAPVGPLDQRHVTHWALAEALRLSRHLDPLLPCSVNVTAHGEIVWSLGDEAELFDASQLAFRLGACDEHTCSDQVIPGVFEHRWTGTPMPGAHRSWVLWTGVDE